MDNQNCMIGFPNRIDDSTITGGSWLAALPLANLKNRTLGRVARSSNLLAASTQFVIDLGKPTNIRALDLRNHNFSLQATFRICGDDAADFATPKYDSGFAPVWPAVYPFGALEWEDDNWWSGRYSDDERGGYIAGLTHVLSSNTLARYWRIEILDPLNAAGFVQLGRVFIGPVWQPSNNMSRGATLAWETGTEVQEAYSGTEFFDVKTPFRVARFSLDWMTEDEGMSNAFELLRRAGIDKEVLWIHNPTDTIHALRRQFLGRLRQLSPVEFPYATVTKNAFEIKELL